MFHMSAKSKALVLWFVETKQSLSSRNLQCNRKMEINTNITQHDKGTAKNEKINKVLEDRTKNFNWKGGIPL